MNPQVAKFVELIRKYMPGAGSPELAAISVRQSIEVFSSWNDEMTQYLASALDEVQASLDQVEILRRSSLTKVREDWYAGTVARDIHWPALRDYLSNVKGWSEDTLTVIHGSSSEVVSLLANPAGEQFHCRGLVVGYVQSGKTANMTAVIAKAVDAGYNLIVLLGGMTNKLRAQTQRRLMSDIVDRHRQCWQLYSTVDDDGDFTYPPNRSFVMPSPGMAQLVVMKKLTSRLQAFLDTVKGTPPVILKKLKVLLIDDECDQASVNSSDDENSMTRINEKIRQILRALPAVSYVGYTATPFANVFIDPFPVNKDELDDLYPEDFITALPRPEGYFGTREVFGLPPSDAGAETNTEAGRNMILTIPDDTLGSLRPARASEKDDFEPKMTSQLEEALLWFLLSCSIRRSRGQVDQHMTMLIHTSPNVIQHQRMAALVENWLSENCDGLERGDGSAFDRLTRLYDEQTANVPLREGAAAPSIQVLKLWMKEVLVALEVAIENGESFTRLDYTGEAKTYIVVGGTVLARGLTLEGLSVSFFLRTSQQYDTLLQMGRWFGYRQGYEDLPRLWTTQDLQTSFRALAQIEEEIRDDIARYCDRGVTPLEFAVRVRSIPGLVITSAAKMRHAYRTSISFEGKHIQTIRFEHRNRLVVPDNWQAAATLVDDALVAGERDAKSRSVLIRKVPLTVIRKFVSRYNICDRHMDLRREMLLDYLDKMAERLSEWHVGVISPEVGTPSASTLGNLGVVNTVARSQLVNGDERYADIKALMSTRDLLIDAETAPASSKPSWEDVKEVRPALPLLLIYPIEAVSSPARDSRTRKPLDAIGDLIGFGMVFPGSKDHAGSYYSVELDIPTPEEIDDEEASIAGQAR